jgi:hypothetical protein
MVRHLFLLLYSPWTRKGKYRYLQRFISILLIATWVHWGSLLLFGDLHNNPPFNGTGESSLNHSEGGKLSLRYDWQNLDLIGPLAREMSAHQENCSLPLIKYQRGMPIMNGVGSDLHVWTQALCNAMQMKRRLWTPTPWLHAGPNGSCHGGTAQSAINCLFPNAELRCPQDVALTSNHNSSNMSWIPVFAQGLPDINGCTRLMSRGNFTTANVRTAGIEYLFSKITADVIREAERQLQLVFPGGVPRDLITVHIRWGDKNTEMDLLPEEAYTMAIQKLLERRPRASPVNIFLATEDPRAVRRFGTTGKALNWTLFVDPYFEEMKPFYREGYNNNPIMTKELEGRPSIIALASFLVSLEANYFVLTTESNWSRMINALRQAVIDPRCGNCTVMMDLKEYGGVW